MLNIHPAIVHIPIGILCLYSLLEIFSVKKLRAKSDWLLVKYVLVTAGFIGAVLALISGNMAAQGLRESLIIERHAFFAWATTWVYGFIFLVYSLNYISRFNWEINRYYKRQVSYLINSGMLAVLALLGLGLITITGALGGAMLYGRQSDPIISLVYRIFVSQ
jgi:uncharacterized membrane protein